MKEPLNPFRQDELPRRARSGGVTIHASVPHSAARLRSPEPEARRRGAADGPRVSACALLAGLAAVTLPVFAPAWSRQSPEQEETPPGVEIKADAQPRKATVGDRIRIEITATLPQGISADMAPAHGQVGDFTVLEFQDRSTIEKSVPPKPTGSPTTEPLVLARLIVALYRPGHFEFPSLPIVLRSADGKEHRAASPPVKVEIVSVLGPQDDKLKSLKKQAEIEEPGRWLYWLGLVLLLLLTVLAVCLFWRRRRKPSLRRPSVPCIDPFSSAEAELRDLLSRGFLERGQTKQFYVALSEIVKRVIEAGCGIATAEKTTSEIMDSLRRSLDASEPGNDPARIESFLIACDLVKFARYVPPAAENETAVRDAFDLLERCRQWADTRASALAQTGEVTGVSIR